MLGRFSSVLIGCAALANGVLIAHDPHDPFSAVAVSPNYAADQTVFAASGSTTVKPDVYALLKTADGGLSWTVCGIPTNQAMNAIAISPAYSSDGTVFVAGAGGLFRSTDSGQTWTPAQSAPLTPGAPVSSVALASGFNYNSSTRTLFVATSNAIYRSTDGGSTWTRLAAQPAVTSSLTVLAVSPNYAADQTLLAGSTANGIFASADGGGSWTLVTPGLSVSVAALAFSPAFSSDLTVFAATSGAGVWVSRTGGAASTWATLALPDNSVTSITLSPGYASDGTLWAATADASGNGGVFQSTNRGGSWTGPQTVSRELATNQTNLHYLTIAAGKGTGGDALYLGMFEGLWTLPSGALSWQYIDTFPTRLIRQIHLSNASKQTIFASTYGGGNLWSSTTGTSWNTTWTFQNTGMLLSATDGTGLSPSFANDGIAFSGTIDGLQETTNGNAGRVDWTLVTGGLPAFYPRALALSPNFASDQTLLVGMVKQQYSGVWRSTNGGANWTQPASVAGVPIVSLAVPPAFDPANGVAFAASNGAADGGIYKSADGGNTWQRVTSLAQTPMDLVAVSTNYATDQTVMAAYATGGVVESNDGGNTWNPIPGLGATRALDIQFSPNYASDGTFFIGTLQSGLLRSTNGVLAASSLRDNFVTAVALAPDFNYSGSSKTLFAASYHGIYKSTDGGNTWTNTKAPSRIEETRSAKAPASEYSPPTITYGNAGGGPGSWTSVVNAQSASTDRWMRTVVSGDTAVLNFVGSGVVWVSRLGPGEGSATVELNGVQYTVNLTGSSNKYQDAVWASPALPCGSYTLTLTATPQSGQEVTLDAFNISNTGCPLVSPQ